jgi:hypothetical protein
MIDYVWILVAKKGGFHDNCHVYMEWIHWTKKNSKETFRHQGNGLAKIVD